MQKNQLSQKVYALISKVPKGRVTTYGTIAKKLKVPNASRAVGAVLRANPHPIVVPCHRVVMSSGELGGYGGGKGTHKKELLLTNEGVEVKKRKVDLTLYLFTDF